MPMASGLSGTFHQIIKLAPDNFTPLSRTPWAGTEIAKRYKSMVVGSPEGGDVPAIGESWEFSCEPDFPSKVLGHNLTLPELVKLYPHELIGRRLANGASSSCDLLVKIINAATPLSLQVHPFDDGAYLKADECGKPESWLILHAEPGAGIYLGFNAPMTREELRSKLQSSVSIAEYLQFVPVEPGDYFEIAPGVPHAIGGGLTLLEPQRIWAGRKGMTYRLWDWGRHYDEKGNIDQQRGAPRKLHLDEGLLLIHPTEQVGEAFVNSLRRYPRHIQHGNASIKAYPENNYYGVIRCQFSKQESLPIELEDGYLVGVPLEGSFAIKDSRIDKGCPFLIPAALTRSIMTSAGNGDIALLYPQGTKIRLAGNAIF